MDPGDCLFFAILLMVATMVAVYFTKLVEWLVDLARNQLRKE